MELVLQVLLIDDGDDDDDDDDGMDVRSDISRGPGPVDESQGKLDARGEGNQGESLTAAISVSSRNRLY
jgi:hypothetical protein